MQEVLVALQNDLASRITIRYTDRLEKWFQLKVRTIHIPDLDEHGHTPGGGWVHEKWENAVVRRSREKIGTMIQKERFYGYQVPGPIIIPGDRAPVILDHLEKRPYDLFIEGALHTFEPDSFFTKLSSVLYLKIRRPVLMVKNFVDPALGTMVVGTAEQIITTASRLPQIVDDLPGSLDFLACEFTEDETVTEINDTEFSDRLEQMLEGRKKVPSQIRKVKGTPPVLADLTRDHAVVVSDLPAPEDPLAYMLSQSPCPILFCPHHYN